MTLKAQARKVKIDKFDYFKIEINFPSKDTTMKRQPMECENVFTNYIFDKRLIVRISYRELLKFNNNKKFKNGQGI